MFSYGVNAHYEKFYAANGENDELGMLPYHFRNPYSESIKEMLTTFGTATYKVGLKVHPNEEDPRVPIMCWGSCAYTIQTIGINVFILLPSM